MQTQASQLLNAADIDILWESVEWVSDLESGGNIYTYSDGSQLIVKADSSERGFSIVEV